MGAADCVAFPESNLIQNIMENFVDCVDSTYGCVLVQGRIAAATKNWWTLHPDETVLLSLYSTIDTSATLKDTPVFLPVKSPTVREENYKRFHISRLKFNFLGTLPAGDLRIDLGCDALRSLRTKTSSSSNRATHCQELEIKFSSPLFSGFNFTQIFSSNALGSKHSWVINFISIPDCFF